MAISSDGTGSPHPPAAVEPQPALNPDFHLSKILNTFITIVPGDELLEKSLFILFLYLFKKAALVVQLNNRFETLSATMAIFIKAFYF